MENDYVSPYLSAYTAIGFNWMRDQGYKIPELVEQRLHAYLRTLLRRDDAYDGERRQSSVAMRSSVRALALACAAYCLLARNPGVSFNLTKTLVRALAQYTIRLCAVIAPFCRAF